MTRFRRASLAAVALVATTAATAAAAGVVPTFAEFRASTVTDEYGTYIVNGDEPIDNDGELHSFYDQMVGNSKGRTIEEGLVVNTVNGTDDVWTAAQARNLTYCVSTRFKGDHDTIVTMMDAAASQWEAASSAINFTYLPAEDAKCTVRNSKVVFSVEPTKSKDFTARAFFPSSPAKAQNVLVVTDALLSSTKYPGQQILAHELGHVLGLRHEHTRPEAGTCFEDNNWRPLTPYDSASIMHYPQCNGTTADLSMTATDIAGIQALYGV